MRAPAAARPRPGPGPSRVRARGRRRGRRPTRSRPRAGRGSRGAANGPVAVDAWVIRRRVLDQALDAAEALGERPHRRPRDELDRLLLALEQERDHPAEVAHLPGGDLVARGGRAARDRARCSTRGCPARNATTARAFAQWRSIRTASVFRPRSTSQASNGPGHGAERLLEEAQPLRDRRVVRRGEAADDVRVAAEVLRRRVERRCRRRGRAGVCRYGVANVLSTTSSAPAAVAAAATARDVDDVQERVGRASRSRRGVASSTSAGGVVGELVGRRVREAVALRLVDLREHPVRCRRRRR